MKRQLRINVMVGVAMALTAVATRALTPSAMLADTRARFDLAAAIPTQFAGWSIDTTIAPVAPNPDSQAALDRIYDQTLARTYVDANGQRVMLSIAYGGDQSKALQLHLPEVCYVAQGFQIVQKGEGLLATGFGSLPVRRLVARADMRNEPITYWITVGDQATRAGFAQKFQLLAYGLSGQIPDGMLVRVSTIDTDASAAYRVQDGFAAALLAALAPQSRTRLLGKPAGR
ncbi:exosortase-associated protein EpsI, B-type [Massilia sp. S19_KUP03_FR1]|uniref:exosortase-associated protein EpsI, B-type n=1 Tax=Massilia sp. S19_KUP03_FR1 TaxID=3025503 RepID=UPI002FCD14AD